MVGNKLKSCLVAIMLIMAVCAGKAYADGWGFGSSWDKPGPNADKVALDTTNFGSNLSSADDTVQKALDTLDDTAGGSGDSIKINGSAVTDPASSRYSSIACSSVLTAVSMTCLLVTYYST